MPSSVQLARRWGANQPGSVVQVDDEQAQWLINNGYGAPKGTDYAPTPGAAPGQDGPDPTISTVPPRPATQRAPRRDNQALPVDGAPPQYNQGINPQAYAEFKKARTSGSSRLAETGTGYLPGGEGPQRAGKRMPADSSSPPASGGNAGDGGKPDTGPSTKVSGSGRRTSSES